jgi:glycosyltransferase involved in cell wall biosynthesis
MSEQLLLVESRMPAGQMLPETKLAVIIPAYKVSRHILDVIAKIGPQTKRIYVIDDACPEHSGDIVEANCRDPRVMVIRHETNQGVGGAMITGYRQALAEDMTVAVKVDGDGQMDPAFVPYLIKPILSGRADYTKGNRFFNLESLGPMPPVRIFGNALLSFMAKLSTGYWNIFDPTNGYTAIHVKVLSQLPLGKIAKRYFFETDMLFRLNTVRAVVVDVPMDSRYGDEVSNLQVSHVIPEFMYMHAVNFCKRFFYNYLLRNFSAFTIQAVVGTLFVIGGSSFGAVMWFRFASRNVPATSGIVMFAALPIILGIQMVLSFLHWDAQNVPTDPLQHRL